MSKLFHPLLLGPVLPGLAIGLTLAVASIDLAFAQVKPPENIEDYAAAEDPPDFDDPAKAVEALKSALAANDFDGVAKLLGLDAAKVRTGEDAMETFAQIREGAARNVRVRDLEGRKIIEIGDRLWPLPFPIVKGEDGKWAFDTYVGLEEIVNRRVGENELQAIETVRAYVEAQKDYASVDRDADGVLEYAQKLISSAGQTDGLYWPADQGEGTSPVGDAINEAALEKAKAGEGYFGYRYRILTSQGDNIAGGRYDYVINDNMIAGFALIAWPVNYAETGVKTFLVNQQGIVYERDLGASTAAIVPFIDRFDPDDTWTVVND
ncbi:hypothetical protein N181_16210 [Sinorhizobium fredii USDA 205]|uniref:DUF2950 domain-containing protein n=1 Tax=Rhizobium fredii TaxID=380 RepID=A0A2A6LWB2_RHIFR|nr:DUF2950 domain-containing protein [Sinorhizobium fredii]ASY73546.1 putative exported protein [Sinorhizobium fredii CCBAU 83666]AWM29624.1 putative exported protein [Sinorhizobium fredii CCBAU 25509]KSV88741.1 hypothetical protein N181_16210 [Sinorhizobium fredii USDA 205]MCG5473698.1 DUF2950 family protein [Sinorhizobium fredii]MQX08832.1 DUF2950 family protein [Sinorhizobium fredii]